MLLTLLSGGEETARAFDAFEHRYIGDRAFENMKTMNQWNGVLKEDWIAVLNDRGVELRTQEIEGNTIFDVYRKRQPLRFGDLPALAGDHAESVEALEELLILLADRNGQNRFIAIRRQWEHMCIWLSARHTFTDLDQCPGLAFDAEENAILAILNKGQLPDSPLAGSPGYIPSRAEQAEFEQLPGYVDLARANRNHFPRFSWQTYSLNHRQALIYAQEYAARMESNERSGARRALRLALLYEGFAQHFLHDSFSSGHLGTHYSGTHKEVLQHTHDTLNRIGKTVKLYAPPAFLWQGNDTFTNAVRRKLQEGWTAFGDQHLFIPEAAFHRLVVIHVATKSLEEVLIASKTGKGLIRCQMCTELVFPVPIVLVGQGSEVPVADKDPAQYDRPRDLIASSSRDVRVAPVYNEGWRMLVTVGPLFGRFADGGSIWDYSRQKDRKVPTTTVATFELGYVRTTEEWMPNFFGAGAVIAPGVRTSIYPLSIGYWSRNVEEEQGFVGGVRLNAGLRIDEANSTINPGPRDLLGGELTIVADGGYRIRSPLTLFTRLEMGTMNLRGRFPSDLSLSADSILHKGGFAMTFGIVYDIAEVFK